MRPFCLCGIALLIGLAGLTAASHAAQLKYCRFGPEIRVLEAKVQPHQGSCAGSVKIQATLWSCDNPDSNDATIELFRERLNHLAEIECQKQCGRRALGCEGHFRPAPICGSQTDRGQALALGKERGCVQECSGRAFTYCSLYETGFASGPGSLRKVTTLVAKQNPNCVCQRVFH